MSSGTSRPLMRMTRSVLDNATKRFLENGGDPEDRKITYWDYDLMSGRRLNPGVRRDYPDFTVLTDDDGTPGMGLFTYVTHDEPEWGEGYNTLRDLWTENRGTRARPLDVAHGTGFDSGMTWQQTPDVLLISYNAWTKLTDADIRWLLYDDTCPIDHIVVELDTMRGSPVDQGAATRALKKFHRAHSARFAP